ncbi:MAG: hypothetical protein AAGF13_07450 [Pseudomonadota bacterium]
MFELLAQISAVGWVFIVIALASLTRVPGCLREIYSETRKPRKVIPGEDPPRFRMPQHHHVDGH